MDQAIIDLHDVYARCSVPNWDGLGAQPVSATAIAAAIKFLKEAHPWKVQPDIIGEPDGRVAMRWGGEFVTDCYIVRFDHRGDGVYTAHGQYADKED